MTIVQRRICLETMRRRADRYPLETFPQYARRTLHTRYEPNTASTMDTYMDTQKQKESIMGTQARDTGQLTISKSKPKKAELRFRLLLFKIISLEKERQNRNRSCTIFRSCFTRTENVLLQS